MGEITLGESALLLLAVSSRHDEAIQWAGTEAAKAWGPCALASPVFSFTETDYYLPTMGADLKKAFFAFEKLMDRADLPDRKIQTNVWEAQYLAATNHSEPRPLNLDPGYITLGKLVLASTKNHAHRIYLRDGICAEVTLFRQAKQWQPWTWTYPDYRRDDYQQFFTRCRDFLKQQLHKDQHA